MVLAFSSFVGYEHVSLRTYWYIGLYFDSRGPAVKQDIVVYGKWAKREANVISYFLRTSEWHPCLHSLFKMRQEENYV